MKTQVNQPHKSKINYTALAMFLVGMAVTFGWVPEELEDAAIQFALFALPVFVAYFRTFKTEPKQ